MRDGSRLSLEFALNQGIAQAAGMISGLIYVRLMSVEQYALYAVGLSALTFLSIGSDLGLTSALSYFWRQGITGGSAFEPRVAAVLRLRSVFLVLASVVCGVLLLKTAATQNLPMTIVFACFGLVLATAWLQNPHNRRASTHTARGQATAVLLLRGRRQHHSASGCLCHDCDGHQHGRIRSLRRAARLACDFGRLAWHGAHSNEPLATDRT